MTGPAADVLERLFAAIESRRGADPQESYTAQLLSRGTRRIAQKFGEEAVEAALAAVDGGRTELIGESADVLYHLLVLWADRAIAPADVLAELDARRGLSGLAEKAARKDGSRNGRG